MLLPLFRELATKSMQRYKREGGIKQVTADGINLFVALKRASQAAGVANPRITPKMLEELGLCC